MVLLYCENPNGICPAQKKEAGMKHLKKTLSVLLALILIVSAFGCAPKNNAAENVKKYEGRDVDYPSDIPKLGEDSVQIHYQRNDGNYSAWTLWLWDPEGTDDGKEDDFNYQDDYGVVASYPLSKFGSLSGGKLGIIVKTKGAWTKDGTDADRFIVFSQLEKDSDNVYHIYLAGGDENMYKTADKIITDSIDTASFRDGTSIKIVCSNPAEKYAVFENGSKIAEGEGSGRSSFTVTIPSEADFGKDYSVEVEFRGSGVRLKADVSKNGLYSSDSFNEKYYYDGELGAIYSKDSTTFRVWSPVASKIELRLYAQGNMLTFAATGEEVQCFDMTKADKGVFECTVPGDLGGKYYTYVVYSSAYPDGKEIVDPYARSAGTSGVRGMVVDPEKASPEGWESVTFPETDRKALTVWEMHIADITSSPTWTGSEANRRKYLGVVESGTTYTEGGTTVKTGFDHIIELGVNAVQLQPIFDQANDESKYSFNWGYNPLNYNVPEGLYSSDPSDGYARIKELKQLVMAFREKGIAVIMDVVYNHVNGAAGSNFDVLMPGYYFRYDANGSLSNGSGCGNETASEHLMMRKFIIDSVCYWTEEYKLGGFRFDLMGLHDIKTMDQVAAAAKAINPNIVIYGEPWTGGATPLDKNAQAVQANANKFDDYGQFNDQMRDALIKGGLNSKDAKGWVTGTAVAADFSAIQAGINGITKSTSVTITDADKTVNYVTCHDNYTLYDRCKAAGITDEDTVRKMCVLANAVVFTSKGTAFMLSGDEMLRTKGGDSNSYQSPDPVNSLDYSLKIKNLDVFENYKALIAFKQQTEELHTQSGGINVESKDGGSVIVSRFSSGGRDYMVINANGGGASSAVDTAGYSVVLDTLGKLSGSPASITAEKYQTVILAR